MGSTALSREAHRRVENCRGMSNHGLLIALVGSTAGAELTGHSRYMALEGLCLRAVLY